VVDTGIGMTQAVLECAFDPFFTTKGSDGTGLGLAMVQGFCRQVGGDVRVMSTPGHGTRFEVWLPTVDANIPRAEPVATPPKRAFAGRVLVVDDTLDVLVVVEQFLCKAGFAVRCANSGCEALAKLADQNPFDLLICDYMMPEMNGVELIRQVRNICPGMPALIISGYADVADFMTDLPNAALLRKPFQAHELLEKVSGLVGQTQSLASMGHRARRA
jgi:CheY-like chemotaxis protein